MVLLSPIIDGFTFTTLQPVHIEVNPNQENWAPQEYGGLRFKADANFTSNYSPLIYFLYNSEMLF